MPTIVNHPELGEIEFPDGVSEEEMLKAIEAHSNQGFETPMPGDDDVSGGMPAGGNPPRTAVPAPTPGMPLTPEQYPLYGSPEQQSALRSIQAQPFQKLEPPLNLPEEIAKGLHLTPTDVQDAWDTLAHGESLDSQSRPPTKTAQVLAGTGNVINKASASLASPEGVALMLSGAGPVPEIGKAIQLAYAGKMAADIPRAATEAGTVFGNPKSTLQEKVEAGGDLALNMAMTGSLMKHGTSAGVKLSAPEQVRYLERSIENLKASEPGQTLPKEIADRIDLRVQKLEAKKADVQKQIDWAETNLKHEAEQRGLETVLSPIDPQTGEAWKGGNYSKIGPDGKMHVDPATFHDILKDLSPEKQKQFIESLPDEEFLHSHVSHADALEYFNNLTTAEKALVRRRYAGSEGDKFSDTQLGHEAIRGALQQMSRVTPREVAEARGIGLSPKMLYGLEKTLRRLRERYSTKASTSQKELLNRIQKNVEGGLNKEERAAIDSSEAAPELAPASENVPFATRRTPATEGAEQMMREGLDLKNQTNRSYELGRKVTSKEEIKDLIRMREQKKDEFNALRAKLNAASKEERMKMLMDPEIGNQLAVLGIHGGQLFNEMLEKATGSVPSKMEPGEKPPVPMTQGELDALTSEVRKELDASKDTAQAAEATVKGSDSAATETGAPGELRQEPGAASAQVHPEEVLRLGTQVAREIKDTAAAFRKKDEPLPPFPKYPELPKGLPPEQRKAAFDEWHKKLDEHQAAVAKWEAEWPEKEPIITKSDRGLIRAITRDPKGGWRVTSFTPFGNEGKYAPWGHREYKTRAEAIRQEAPRDQLIHAEEMPDVLTEAEIKAMRDNPAAKRRDKGQQGEELPLTPGSKDAPRNTEELGLPQVTKEPVTAAKIADLTKEHLSVAKPSFANFLDDVKKRFGDVQPGQVREAWEDATWQRLMDAPGSELEGLVKRLGLTETLGDSPIPDIREKTQARATSTPMFPKPALTVMETPARRANAIARIGEKLIGQALRKSADWKRKGVKPEDIGWWRVKEGQLPAFREVTPEELNSPDLGPALTQGSAESRGGPKTLPGKPAPETVTKRLVALQDRATGRVDLVSVYKTGRGAVYAADPTKTGERIHTPLQELLAKKTIAGQSRFVPRYSVLLDEPVQGFRQSFKNEADFQERFAAEAADEAKRRGEVGEEPLAKGMEKPPERGLLFRGEEAKPDDLRAMSDLLMGEGELTQEAMQENLEALFAENRPKNPATGEPVPLTIRQLKGLDALVWARDRLQEISQEKGRPISSEVALSNLIEYIHENAYLGRSRLAAKLGYELRIPPKPVPGRAQGKATPDIGSGSSGNAPAAFRRPTKAELEWGVTKIGWGAQQALRALGRQMGATNVRGPITRAIVRWRDAADNIASNAGRQAERGVEVNLENNSALERAALITYRQTNKGTPALLDAARAAVEARLPQFEAERNAKAVEQGRLMLNSIEFLRDPANAARVDRANEYFSHAVGAQFALENSAGIAFTSRENYTPQVYDASGFSDDALLFPSRILGHRFTQAQNFPSYFDAYQAGYYPMKFDGAAVLGNRIRRGQKRVQYRLWLDRLKGTLDPRTGEEIASETIPYDVTLANGTVETRYRPPSEEYELFSIAPGQRPIAVRKGYKDLLDVLTMQSPLAKSAPFRAALNLSAVLKHGVILIADTFHPSRIGQYGASILGLEPKVWKIGNKGSSALDYADAEMDRAVQKGFISQEEVDWARGTETVRLGPNTVDLSRRQILEFGQREGLNIGRVTDSLYRHFIDEIPGLSQFNRWTFDKVTRGLMAERFVSEFIRQNKKFPNVDARTLMGDIVRDLNFRFGSIGRQGLFRNPVMRDINQVLFLAPQWIEGLAQSEARVYSRLLTAPIRTAFEAATGAEKRPVFGTLGRSMARGLAAYMVLTQAMNFITRGHGTWDNEEDGHKLDAWIPDITGKTPGYFISPLSVFAEVTHDMVKYLGSANKSVDAVAKIVGNKLGPWGRVFTTLAFRENERGEKLTTTASVAKEAASKLFPAPISLSKPLRAAAHAVAPESVAPNRPGEMQRQLTASAGFKLDPAHTEIQRIYDQANDWLRKTKQKREEDVYTPTENAFLPQLRRAIRDGDNVGAMQLIEKLRYGTGDFSGRTDEQIAKAMAKYAKAPFTGTLEKEKVFYADLKPAEQKVYDAAMEAKAKEFEKFIELFEKRPERRAD